MKLFRFDAYYGIIRRSLLVCAKDSQEATNKLSSYLKFNPEMPQIKEWLFVATINPLTTDIYPSHLG